jgi:hypothetical protein
MTTKANTKGATDIRDLLAENKGPKMSRSMQRRLAAQRGDAAPDFSGKEGKR